MRKRPVWTIVALILTIMPVWAAGDMNVIPLSSPVYGYVDALYVLEGHAAPEGARPWTEADLRQQLTRITPTSKASQNLLDIIEGFLTEEEDYVDMRFGLELEPTLATHTNEEAFDTSIYWAEDVLNTKPVRLNAGMSVSDYFSADIGLSLGYTHSSNANAIDEDKHLIDSDDEDRFNRNFSTNTPFVFSSGPIDLDFSDNNHVSLGTPYISVALGRGRLSWGNGMMGNLFLGDTLPYHDYVNISASSNSWFDYDMLVSFYEHPLNYGQSFESTVKGIQMLVAHRFEFRMFSDKLRLSINEATMYQSEDGTIDMRIFNPLLIMHGLYITANANSLMTLELEWAPIKNLQIYFSAALDDFAMPGEPQPPAEDSTPNMLGFMGGVRGTAPHNTGWFSITGEAVYLSPFMYHKDSYSEDFNYALDFIGTVRYAGSSGGRKIFRQYLSFPFGSDALAFSLDASYNVPLSWKAGFNFFAMVHGVTGVNSVVGKYDGTQDGNYGWLTTQNPFNPDEKGSLSYTFDFGLYGQVHFLDNLSLSSSLDFIWAVNHENMAGNDQFDLQFTLSLCYSIT